MGKVRKAMPEAKKEKSKRAKLSKFIKKSKDRTVTKRDNKYVFTGFYDRLKNIDVKHAHASLGVQSHMFDHLQDDEQGQTLQQKAGDGLEHDDLSTSNFIQLLRTEKFKNHTVEFNKIFRDIETLCFSYPLLILNKKKVVQKLLSYMENEELKSARGIILDLCIALIKDLRHEVYEEFLHDILPKAIQVLDAENLDMMEKVFQLLSFSFKYLIKPIKENIRAVFSVYIMLLEHKNRFIRKFSAQSFSYALRKVNIDSEFVNFMGSLLDDESAPTADRVNGISELIFEVVSGHGDELHSKGESILAEILASEKVCSSQPFRQMIRILLLKLVNAIDIHKLGAIFEQLIKHLANTADQTRLTLLFKVLNQSVALKFGRRISMGSLVVITQALNNLVQKQAQKLKELPLETRAELAGTLGLLFYFKHGNVMQIFQKSKLDFATAKTAYTSGVFNLIDATDSECLILRSFYQLLMQPADAITAEQAGDSNGDIDVDKILRLKQSNSVTKFSPESHANKARHLIKPLARQTVKLLASTDNADARVLTQIGLLVSLIARSGEPFCIDLPTKAVDRLIQIRQAGEMTDLMGYTLAKFIKLTKQADQLCSAMAIQPQIQDTQNGQEVDCFKIDIDTIVAKNIVLSAYKNDLNKTNLLESVNVVIDIKNKGYVSQVKKHTQTILFEQQTLKITDCSDLLMLKNFKPVAKLRIADNQELFMTLNKNLSKNATDLRKETLRVLTELFETELFLKEGENVTVDPEQISKFYKGQCPILGKLLEYEQIKLAFETERPREQILRKIEVQISTGLVPAAYMNTVYHLMIGSLWLKFTPGFVPAMSLIQQIITQMPEIYMPKFLSLFENIGHLTQFTNGDNEDLDDFLISQTSLQKVEASRNIFEEIYLGDAVGTQEYILLKDFHFNLCKTLQPIIDRILTHKEHKSTLFALFERFYEREYLFLHQGCSQEQWSTDESIKDTMVKANMVDSEEFRSKRKRSYGKLCALVELLSKASQLNKLSPTQTEKLIEQLMRLLSSQESSLQRNVLTCLLKCSKKTDSFLNRTAKLPKYAKLLDGLADDTKFKEMLPVINYGSSDAAAVTQAYNQNADYEAPDDVKTEGKSRGKGSIPRLEKEDRLELLPVIIKLLFSKLVKKKGAINKNSSISDRRNVVYIFLSSLDPATEFPIFFKELLEPLNLSDLIEDETISNEEIKRRLVRISFNQYAAFIATIDVIFKQLGTLMSHKDFLGKLSRVLTLMLNLSKQFSGHLKEQKEAEGETVTAADDNDTGMTLYRFVGKQSKMCLRKGLKIVKQLTTRFSFDRSFTEKFTALLYSELIEDQLSELRLRYISEKSQLVEILTLGWSSHPNCLQNYVAYPQVIPSLISMLQSTKIDPDNIQLIFAMLRNIVEATLDKATDQEKIKILSSKIETEDAVALGGELSDAEMDEGASTLPAVDQKATARSILHQHARSIGSNLHIFWSTNQNKLRQSVIASGQTSYGSNKAAQGKQSRDRSFQIGVLSSLTFIVSELSAYLKPEQSADALSFLEMIVALLSNKQIMHATSQNTTYISSRQNRNEDLLVFGCSAIAALLKTLLSTDSTRTLVSETLLNRILLMLLTMESKKARESFTEGLEAVLSQTGILKPEILLAIKDMNSTKKGMADVTLDFEKVLAALETITKLLDQGLSQAETSALLFNMLNLLRSEEYAVRDYAQHTLTKLVEKLSEPVFLACEKWILTQVKINTNELVLKSLLSTYKLFIAVAKGSSIKGCIASDLHPLLSAQKNEEDFFTQILSMQLQSRRKALRKLIQQQGAIDAGSFRKAILPLVDYLIFDTKSHMENRRNTVRYSKEESTQLMEDALNVYVAYARRLNWQETFKLIRKFLYKIDRAQRLSLQHSAEKEDTEMEKIVTKCLCKVLEGLALNENISLPDAIEIIERQAKEREMAHPERGRTEFSSLLDELVGKASKEEDADLTDEDESDEEKADTKDAPKEEIVDIIQVDKEMRNENDDDINMKRKIQMKLQRKVLPVLQRHLFEKAKTKSHDTQHQKPIRSFVAIAIAKIIRKLPIQFFRSQLQKLINLIVVKGLRAGDLVVREKARRALIKVLGEVSPRFLQIIFNEMQFNLTKGYQLHVHLYTIHYVLNHLTGSNTAGEKLENQLQPGQITSAMLHSMSDLLMRELFGDLMDERNLTETQKKHIKESKARKAIPIYEVLTQYIDFKKSFLDLIAPIVKILEENPNFTRIQQCEELLNRISSQLLKNTTLSADELLVFLYSIVERGIGMSTKTKVNDEKAPRDYGAKVDNLFKRKSAEQLMEDSHGIQIEWVKTSQHVSKKKTEEICGRVLANFGLQCLRKALKQKGLILAGDEHEQRALTTIAVKQELKDKLDPFVVLFLRAFKTFYNPIIVTTLHILVNVIHLGLPAFKSLMKKFLIRIFKLFNVAQSNDKEFLNTLFRCTTELIKTYSVYTDLSETQIKTLVLIIKSNVSNFSTQSHVFQCLKSIINRKFLCPDLYDLMETIEEMMVTNISKATRSVCAQIFVQFILEYPLEPERIQQHINHMLKNLTYFDTDGRLQLLEVFQTFVDRFPTQLLDTYAELFFFTLFLRLVNDPAQKCRDKIALVLKRLISKTSHVRSLLETCFKIGAQQEGRGEKQESLIAGKLQLLQLFAECGKLTPADIDRTVGFTGSIIARHAKVATKLAQSRAKDSKVEIDDLEINPVNADFLKGIDLGDSSEEEDAELEVDEAETEGQEEESEAKWSKAYLAVSALENLFTGCDTKLIIAAFSQELGQDIVTLAWRHQNFWVKLVCQRLLGHMFASCLSTNNFSSIFGSVFAEKENLLKLIYQMLNVFNSVMMNEEMANQLVKNLTFLQGQLLGKCEIIDDTYVKAYKKASFIGRKLMGEITDSTGIKLEALIQFFAVSVRLFASQESSRASDTTEDKTSIDNELIRRCLCPMLELVYRTYSDEQMPNNVRTLSTELVDQLSGGLEKDFWITSFKNVQQSIVRNRMERKMKQRLLVGTEEGQQIKAKRRIAKTVRKKEKKTEKVMQYMMNKPSHGLDKKYPSSPYQKSDRKSSSRN